jgi:flavin reductase (DIM6/NTAB) family NADH-FMN oxidoreductase RutF
MRSHLLVQPEVQPPPDGPGHPIAAPAFRQAMRNLPGGVSVITAGRVGGRSGLTATSVTSLAAEPATLLVCVNRTSSTFPLIEQEGRFGVNVLAADHADVADRFSGRGGIKGEARYEQASWTTLATGAPLLADALAALDCEVEEVILRHSHGIILGRVRAVSVREDGEGLVYWRGGYRRS